MKKIAARLLSAFGAAAVVVGALLPAQVASQQAAPEPAVTQPSAQATPSLQTAGTSSKAVKAGAALTGPRATSVLAKLTVKGKAPKTGYDRTRWFGAAWGYDYNKNHCQTRQDILRRDMSKVHFKKGSHCLVASGTLADPYTGSVQNWRTGRATVDIDHVVALGNAWISGAQYWSGTRGQTLRRSIANDPLNLVAASSSQNRAKGDKNAAEWLPKNKRFRCQYVATQISVKYKYRLAVTSSEKAAMKRVLKGCPTQRAAKVSRYSIATGASVAKKSVAKKSTAKKAPAKKSTTKKAPAKTVSKKVHPGAFCSEHGYRGKASNGHTYTCKTSSTEKRYRWRR